MKRIRFMRVGLAEKNFKAVVINGFNLDQAFKSKRVKSEGSLKELTVKLPEIKN